MQSLRTRAVRGAAIWAVFTVVISFLALNKLFNSYSVKRFDEHLTSHHRQLIIALGNTNGDTEKMRVYVDSPGYQNAFSGTYWQLLTPTGNIVVSESMLDTQLPIPTDLEAGRAYWVGEGPREREIVRGIHQKVILEDGGVWIVTAAESLSALQSEQLTMRRGLLVTMICMGIIALIGVTIQHAVILAPLTQLRKDVAQLWTADKELDERAYPEEVAPFVADINRLLHRNRSVISSSRRQAADLAHALKTPVAVLQNCLEKETRTAEDFEGARAALDKIQAQIHRSLARIRAGHSAATAYKTDLLLSAERLARLFRAMPSDKPLALTIDIAKGTTVAMDQQDIEEVLGNLIENALKWRREHVQISSQQEENCIKIWVDDDGMGVAEAHREDVLRPGERLDVSAPGTGLGLAIAQDLVSAYGGVLHLDTAPELGGLRVAISLPLDGTSIRSGQPIDEG